MTEAYPISLLKILYSCDFSFSHRLQIQDFFSWLKLAFEVFRDWHFKGLIGLHIHELDNIRTHQRKDLGASFINDWDSDFMFHRMDDTAFLFIEDTDCINPCFCLTMLPWF